MTTTQRNGKGNIKETGKNHINGETKATVKGLINGDKTGRQTVEKEGYVLIISNANFYQIPGDPLSRELPQRQGAENDSENLELVLTDLGFKVVRKDNLKKWEMEHEIKTLARADHKHYDCFLIILSSYGNVGKLYGSDGQQMLISQQLKLFKPDVCKDLKDKPKLCFFQACPMVEDDVLVLTDTMIGSKLKNKIADDKPRFLINDVDFLVGYSTLPGYDLVTILEDVNRDLSVKKSKYRAGDVTAVSTFVSCLRGPIFFQ